MAKKPLFDLDEFRSQPLPSEEQVMSGWRGGVSKPVVSVLCNTYNHKPYIGDALRGFLIQKTDFPFEVVVHDDASTDGTTDIVCDYSKRYPKIIRHIVQSDNQYSKGIRPTPIAFPHSRGEYIAMCEGDDFWISSNKLQDQFDALTSRRDINLCVHPAWVIFESKRKSFRGFIKGSRQLVIGASSIVASKDQFAPTGSYFFRSESFRSMPDWFFDSKDLPFGDYFIESILGINGAFYMPNLYSAYRLNSPGSYTHRSKILTKKETIERFSSIVYYTKKLRCVAGIPEDSLEKRLRLVLRSYVDKAAFNNSRDLFDNLISLACSEHIRIPAVVRFGRISIFTFFVYRIVCLGKLVVKKMLLLMRGVLANISSR